MNKFKEACTTLTSNITKNGAVSAVVSNAKVFKAARKTASLL
jgi:hypothetical protein